MRETRLLKRIVAAFLCAVAVCAFLAMPAFAAPAYDKGETLTVGVPVDRCPVFYQDAQTGEVVGIGADLMRAVADEAGYAVSIQPIKEETLKDALDNEEYDVVMPFGSAIPSASGRPTIVSDNLMQTPFTLVTDGRGDLPPINESRVGMLKSLAAGAETVRQLYPGVQITLYDTMAGCVDALRAGEVDALLHNSYVWSYVLQKPAYSKLEVQPSAMFSMDFRAGTLDTPAGREIIDRLNEGIAALPDTRRQAIILDYTSRRLYQYDAFDYLYEYGAGLLLAALLLALIILGIVTRQHAYRRKQEEKMRRLVDHDPLTGLLSLNGFRKRVEELLRAHPDIPYILSYSNIKDFKYINDSLGRAAGDELLCFWAEKAQGVLSEVETAARTEGDHMVVLRRLGDEDQMLSDEKRVFVPVQSYFADRGKGRRVQTSTGLYALTPEDYQNIDVDHMLDFARVAEKRVRDTRRNGYEFYNPKQWERGKLVADVVSRLPLAIEAGEFEVWYQPQVNYEMGKVIGAEALCRWNHAKLGWLHPADFIAVLEEAGLIYELDAYVWETVCKDLRRWNEQGNRRSVSVNLSRGDIREDRDIPGHFLGLVQSYGIGFDQLRIEITETAFVKDAALLIHTTQELRSLGFQVEMDDFGSGYSSLHMLKEVPIDRIKLDLHFLAESDDPQRSRIIVSHIVKMVRALGMGLIAEGVEHADQAEFLLHEGCPEMQGYHFYKPMPAEELEAAFENPEIVAR